MTERVFGLGWSLWRTGERKSYSHLLEEEFLDITHGEGYRACGRLERRKVTDDRGERAYLFVQ